MTDWTAGYVSDIGYTFGYYPELNPLRVRLAFLNAGLVPPPAGAACELGFGQGMSVNLHAASSVDPWFGTDFNPAQAAFAQQAAAASGAGAKLYDQSFAEFCARSDLPDFDYIGLHGIWSWISDENRAVIVDFVRRKLKIGGVFYISYNSQPGWAAMVPLRDLLTRHSDVMGTPGQGIVGRIDGALEFAAKLLAADPIYARANPQVVERIKTIKGQDRSYLAHEYFNRDWLPMSFTRMAEWLAPAKLNFACSAHYLDALDALNLSAAQRDLLNEIPDAMFRCAVRDFMVNQQFRKDYWVRGARKLNALAQSEALRRQRVVLVPDRAGVSLKVNGLQGEVSLHKQIYEPILDALADHQPKSLEQIVHAVKDQDITFTHVREATFVLCGTGVLNPAQDEAVIGEAKKHSDKLNEFLCEKARGGGDIAVLASPVTGGGVGVGRFPQLFLLARTQGSKQPAEWAQFVWQTLALSGQRIFKDGRTLETAEEHLAELTAQAQAFADTQIPVLKSLGVI